MDIIPTLAVIFLVLIIPLAGALAAFEEWLGKGGRNELSS